MGYIGKQPETGRYGKLDQISAGFNGSTATFNLTVDSEAVYPVNPQVLIISLNGVLQQPGTDYTVSAATITFTTNPASGVGFFGVILGDSLDIGTPSDGSVTVVKMAANSVDSDQYVDGSIDLAHMSVNSIDSDQYVDGSIDTVHIGDNQVTGTKIAMGSDAQGDILYYDGTNYVRLAKGTADQILTMNDGATAPGWETLSAGGDFTNGGDAGALILGTNDSNSLTLETNNTARMVIAAGGDVSIVGGAKFILDGAGGNTYFTDDTDTVELYVGGTHAQRWDKGGSGIYELHYNIQSQFSDGTASAPGICFRGGTPSGFYRPNVSGEYSIGFVANGTEKMRLAHNGKFGIGTTSPAMTLHVEESGGDYSAKFKTTHGSAVNGIHLEGTASSSPSGRWFTAKWTPGDEDKAAIAFDGTFYSRANSYGGFSDERLKENIVDAPSSLAELMKLKIKDFNLIGDGVEGTQRGIIAQEFLADGVSIPNFIKTLEPDVTTPDAIEYYTAAYSKLIPWLVQAIQELNAKVDALGS